MPGGVKFCPLRIWEDGEVSEPTPAFKPVIAPGAAKRANASIVGMLLAVFSTVAIVLTIVWLNPEPKPGAYRQNVDVAQVAGYAADTAGFVPVAPMPEGWSANYARWNPPGSDGVSYWDVGYVSANNSFIALRQSITANPTWTAEQAQNAPVTGVRTIAGRDWELRDKPKGERSLVLTSGPATIILTGAAGFEDFDVLAAGAAAQLDAAAAPSSASTASSSPTVTEGKQ